MDIPALYTERAYTIYYYSILLVVRMLARHAVYSVIAASNEVVNFPILSLEDLRTLTLEIYEDKQAENYTHEYLKHGGSYEVMKCHDFPNLLRAKSRSRHFNRLWVKYDSEKEGVEAICMGYCTCKCGARMVGCCAHVSSVLWFLGWKRHQSDEPISSGPEPKGH